MDHLQVRFKVSQRRACKVVGLHRSTKRYVPREDVFKEKLRERIIYFAKLYGRYGHRKITELLNREGWNVGKDRVHRIWREEGLQVPQKQPKRARLWFNDGSCLRPPVNVKAIRFGKTLKSIEGFVIPENYKNTFIAFYGINSKFAKDLTISKYFNGVIMFENKYIKYYFIDSFKDAINPLYWVYRGLSWIEKNN